MNIRKVILTAALGLAFTGAAGAQVITFNPRTGDIGIDSQLGYMNDYGRSNRDYFIDDVVNSYGAPRYLVNDLLTTRHWSPGDVYYACALAYQAHRPCGDVAHMYEQDRGQGWGVIAKRMGIKPGSAQFHALKGRIGKSNGKFKKHGMEMDHHDGPGNSGKHDESGRGDDRHEQMRRDDGRDESGKSGKGKSDDGPGKSGKGKDKGKGNGR